MGEIEDLKKQLAQLKKKSEDDLKKIQLKGQIKHFQKKERIKQFDKKHKVLGILGRLGAGAGKTVGKVGKTLATPPTPAQQKAMKVNQERLKKLLSM